MGRNPQFPANLVTFTGEILSGKLHFLCSVINLLDELNSSFLIAFLTSNSRLEYLLLEQILLVVVFYFLICVYILSCNWCKNNFCFFKKFSFFQFYKPFVSMFQNFKQFLDNFGTGLYTSCYNLSSITINIICFT